MPNQHPAATRTSRIACTTSRSRFLSFIAEEYHRRLRDETHAPPVRRPRALPGYSTPVAVNSTCIFPLSCKSAAENTTVGLPIGTSTPESHLFWRTTRFLIGAVASLVSLERLLISDARRKANSLPTSFTSRTSKFTPKAMYGHHDE